VVTLSAVTGQAEFQSELADQQRSSLADGYLLIPSLLDPGTARRCLTAAIRACTPSSTPATVATDIPFDS
jgi:hypothetical protein